MHEAARPLPYDPGIQHGIQSPQEKKPRHLRVVRSGEFNIDARVAEAIAPQPEAPKCWTYSPSGLYAPGEVPREDRLGTYYKSQGWEPSNNYHG